MSETADFAILGHQASWSDIQSVINGIRSKKHKPLPLSEIKKLFPALPPRSLFEIEIMSTYSYKKLSGKYIETFISPDQLLCIRHLRENINKVKAAAKVAEKLKIPITTLGGFTSILLEGKIDALSPGGTACFTTGNTLAAALIAEGVKQACDLLGKLPSKSTLLVIGATGDLGTACSMYFNTKFKNVMLAARNRARLNYLSQKTGIRHRSVHIQELIPEADVIIAVASSENLRLDNLKEDVLIADAGYPKNIIADILPPDANIFHAGMACVEGGYAFFPEGYLNSYSFPFPNIGHGCILESVVLAFENRQESYSCGRGNITVKKMEEILEMSYRHGIVLAPFFNENSLWSRPAKINEYEKNGKGSG